LEEKSTKTKESGESGSLLLAGTMAADVLSAFGVPGGALLSKGLDLHLAKRRREAANILINEIARGHHGEIRFEEHDIDPLIEIVLRFSKAVEEGAARENLKLLAQVIAGLKKNKVLESDRFRKWCSVLEHLTRDELVVLGRAYRIAIRDQSTQEKNTFAQDLISDLEKCGYTSGETSALCASLARTGLLIPIPAVGSIIYQRSPWLMELGRLADLSVERD
jgi:hypothetical protein